MKVRELILALSEYDGDERVYFEGSDGYGEVELLDVDVVGVDEDGDVVLKEELSIMSHPLNTQGREW